MRDLPIFKQKLFSAAVFEEFQGMLIKIHPTAARRASSCLTLVIFSNDQLSHHVSRIFCVLLTVATFLLNYCMLKQILDVNFYEDLYSWEANAVIVI